MLRPRLRVPLHHRPLRLQLTSILPLPPSLLLPPSPLLRLRRPRIPLHPRPRRQLPQHAPTHAMPTAAGATVTLAAPGHARAQAKPATSRGPAAHSKASAMQTQRTAARSRTVSLQTRRLCHLRLPQQANPERQTRRHRPRLLRRSSLARPLHPLRPRHPRSPPRLPLTTPRSS